MIDRGHTYWDLYTATVFSVLATINGRRLLTFVFLLLQRSQLLWTRCPLGALTVVLADGRAAGFSDMTIRRQAPATSRSLGNRRRGHSANLQLVTENVDDTV